MCHTRATRRTHPCNAGNFLRHFFLTNSAFVGPFLKFRPGQGQGPGRDCGRPWPRGPVGLWAHGPMGPWACGPMGPWAHGPMGPMGPMGPWAHPHLINTLRAFRRAGLGSLLAADCWLQAAGCWLLADGCWLLAAGCWQIYVLGVLRGLHGGSMGGPRSRNSKYTFLYNRSSYLFSY